jgi:Protein of unknown function (DUF559)
MHGEDPTLDAKLAILAANQHGVVAYRQLARLGFGRGAIEHRLRSRRLHRMYKGVYGLGYRPETREAWEMAAVLRCGAGAVVSHWTASARWELLRPTGGWVHVSVASDIRVKRIRIHLVKPLHPADTTKRDGIPITSVPRTLLDIAGVADERVLRRAVNQAARSGRLNRRAVHEVLEQNPRRTGTKQLRAVIAAVNPSTHRSRSDLEVAFLNLCSRYGIETPVMNGTVMGIEVDFHWPGTNLIVELDSYEYHRTPQEFDNDRRKDARMKMAGYEVLRVSDAWLDSDPAGVAETVRTLLAYRD